jgi:hypothetical protein
MLGLLIYTGLLRWFPSSPAVQSKYNGDMRRDAMLSSDEMIVLTRTGSTLY